MRIKNLPYTVYIPKFGQVKYILLEIFQEGQVDTRRIIGIIFLTIESNQIQRIGVCSANGKQENEP